MIEMGYLYVDKTPYIHRLVTEGQLYFLSRPRRFGKSVLVSTLEALFRGQRHLFQGLYIADRWHWRPSPVLRLDLLGIESHNREVLERDIDSRLQEQARRHGLELTGIGCANRFRELILKLSEGGRVAVLIDEYDKPILDHIADREPGQLSVLAEKVGDYLEHGEIDLFCEGLRSFFAAIPYNIFVPDKEAYYHTVIWLVLSLAGVDLACEIQTSGGRIDAVLETGTRFYVAEFKWGSAYEALAQIEQKGYAMAYRGRGKSVHLLGIGIDPKARNIADWRCVAGG